MSSPQVAAQHLDDPPRLRSVRLHNCFDACVEQRYRNRPWACEIEGQSRAGCTMREPGPSAAASSGTSFHAGATAPAILFLSAIGERCHTHR